MEVKVEEDSIRLIDFHTHQFPDKIAARTVEILKAGIYKCQGYEFHERADGTLSGLLKSMQENDVDVSVVLPIATKPAQTPTINRCAKEINEAYRGRIVSFGSLHPQNEDWEQVLEGLAEDGFTGIKLHPEFQKCYVDEKETLRILEKCEKLGLYCVFHAGADIGIEPPVHCTPKHLKHVLEYVSGKYIIAAHLGGWRMWDEVEAHLAGTEIYLDTAFAGQFLDKEQYRRIIRNHGADRILFGSDSPWEAPKETLGYLRALNLSEEEMEKILSQNAKRILGKALKNSPV